MGFGATSEVSDVGFLLNGSLRAATMVLSVAM